MSRPLTRTDHIHVGQIYRSTQDTVYRLCLIAAIKQHPTHKTDRGEPLIIYDCLKLTITETKTFKLIPASYSRSELMLEFPYLSYSCAYPSHVFTANYERRNKLTKEQKFMADWFIEHATKETALGKVSPIHDDFVFTRAYNYIKSKLLNEPTNTNSEEQQT